MKKNLVPLLGIAFVVAILATGLFYGLFITRLRSPAALPSRPLVVAARVLERGTVIAAGDVKVAFWPGDELKGMLGSAEEAVGQTVLETVQEGEPVLAAKISSARRGPGSLVRSGMRVVSVHVTDSSGVVAMLRPGFKVDVQVVSSRNGNSGESLRTIMQNIEVLTSAATENGRPVVNLLVSPSEADTVGLADSTARIRLTLRNPSDAEATPRPAVNMASLLAKPAASRVTRATSVSPPLPAPQKRVGTATAALR